MRAQMSIGIPLICIGFFASAGAHAESLPIDVVQAYIEAVEHGDAATGAALFKDTRDVTSVVNGRVSIGLTAIREHWNQAEWRDLQVDTMSANRISDNAWLLFLIVSHDPQVTDSTERRQIGMTFIVDDSGDEWKIWHHHANDVEIVAGSHNERSANVPGIPRSN